MGRQHDEVNWLATMTRADPAAQFNAIAIGHHPVRDHYLRPAVCDQRHRFITGAGVQNRFAGRSKKLQQLGEQDWIIFNN